MDVMKQTAMSGIREPEVYGTRVNKGRIEYGDFLTPGNPNNGFSYLANEAFSTLAFHPVKLSKQMFKIAKIKYVDTFKAKLEATKNVKEKYDFIDYYCKIRNQLRQLDIEVEIPEEATTKKALKEWFSKLTAELQEDELEQEKQAILNAKHFTDEQKQQMIEELHGGFSQQELGHRIR